jgi:Tfp pilus assembly pilus retraction ATPase PilT
MSKKLSNIQEILKAGVKKDASEVHVKVGTPPMYRIHREMYIDDTHLHLRWKKRNKS